MRPFPAVPTLTRFPRLTENLNGSLLLAEYRVFLYSYMIDVTRIIFIYLNSLYIPV